MLVCNATTPEEMRKELVSLIRHRATQERAVIGISSTAKRDAMAHEHAAKTLDVLARHIEEMQIISAWPSGLRETQGKPIAEMSEDEFNELMQTTRRAIDMPSRHFYNK